MGLQGLKIPIFQLLETKQTLSFFLNFIIISRLYLMGEELGVICHIKVKCMWNLGGGMNWEIGTDKYTLLSIKQITNENLLCSTGNSTQFSVGPKWEGNPKKRGYMCMYG